MRALFQRYTCVFFFKSLQIIRYHLSNYKKMSYIWVKRRMTEKNFLLTMIPILLKSSASLESTIYIFFPIIKFEFLSFCVSKKKMDTLECCCYGTASASRFRGDLIPFRDGQLLLPLLLLCHGIEADLSLCCLGEVVDYAGQCWERHRVSL